MELTTQADPKKRIRKFLRKYHSAPDDVDIDIRVGRVAETGEAAVIVGMGKDLHCFTAIEARIIADAAEDTLRSFPRSAEVRGFPDLITALRYGADVAEQRL